MRKILILAILILIAATGLWASNMDLIVMVDTSSSMLPFFDDLLQYLFSDILMKNLNYGDTFHLLSFSSTVTVELEERIVSKQSAINALRKINFLKQKLLLGKYTDLVLAIKETIRYAESLSSINSKRIFLLTDGIHDPPPGSEYSNEDPVKVNEEMQQLAQKIISKGGWSVNILQIPTEDMINENRMTESPSDQHPEDTQGNAKLTPFPRNQYLDQFADKLGITIYPYKTDENKNLSNRVLGFPVLIFPDNLGNQSKDFAIPFKIQNFLDEPVIIRLRSIKDAEGNIFTRTANTLSVPAKATVPFNVPVTLPDTYEKGPLDIKIQLSFEDDSRISPKEGQIQLIYSGNPWTEVSHFIVNNLFIIILVLIAAGILALLFFYVRKQFLEDAFSDKVKLIHVSAWDHKTQEDMKDMIEMKVDFQNPNIGTRNIRKFQEGKTYGVGGSHSSFLIFLVPVPPDIAEIRMENNKYIFTPLDPAYFPDITKPVKNCLDTDINVQTPKGYKMIIRFIRYISPLYRINSLLHSIYEQKESEEPGK
ncbi:MAG: VWA domain-containing protein [Spirochaetales bacterium]|nr:VWA domain-containing protein [Spirochaetales bacterium]